MIEVTIAGVYEQQKPDLTPGKYPDHFLVVLHDGAQRYMSIWMGLCEALAISSALKNEPPKRLMIHDFVAELLRRVSANLNEVRIVDVRNEVFDAIAAIRVDEHIEEMSLSASDALALAVRMGSPILVGDNVWTRYSEAQ